VLARKLSRGGTMKVLATVESNSGNGSYEIREGGDGQLYCTCPAWKFGQRPCKHMQEWAANHEPVTVGSLEAQKLLTAVGMS